MIATQSTATESVTAILDPAASEASALYETAVASLPRIGVAVVVGALALLLGLFLAGLTRRALNRARVDRVVAGLLLRILRFLLVFGAILFGLAVAGVPVGSALTGLAVAGVAVGLAVQGILENFIAGIILSFRRPFRAGDQIISGDQEGTVETIDLRVTKLRDYDGETVLIPNRDVYSNVLINLTSHGKRRSTATVSVDYRNDHDEAREVLARAVGGVPGVLSEPAPQVLLVELADSGVNFDILYWTSPFMDDVRTVQDRVLATAKRALEDAGMTIPWPIRTLIPDGVFTTATKATKATKE